MALIESIGLMPTVSLKVTDLPEKSHLTAQTKESVGDLITKGLAQRPDLVAKLANVRSKEYEIRRIRAEYYPKVTLDTHFIAERNLSAALATSHDTQSAIYTTPAALALSVSDLARPMPPPIRQPRR